MIARNLAAELRGDCAALTCPSPAAPTFWNGDDWRHEFAPQPGVTRLFTPRMENRRLGTRLVVLARLGQHSIVRPASTPCFGLFRKLAKRFGHIEQSRLVIRSRDLLSKSNAFGGVSTVVDNRKWRQATLPRVSGKSHEVVICSTRRSVAPTNLPHNIVEEQSSNKRRCRVRGLRRRSCWSLRNTGSTRRTVFAWHEQ
jgi:hypothetical protein